MISMGINRVKVIPYWSGQYYHSFIKHSLERKLIILLVYMDDMIFAGDDLTWETNHERKACCSDQDEGSKELKVLHWTKVASKERDFMSQRKYVLDHLKEIS